MSDLEFGAERWLAKSIIATCTLDVLQLGLVECREMMNNPEALRAAMNPDNLQAVMQMQQAMQRLQGTGLVPQGGGMPGMGGAGKTYPLLLPPPPFHFFLLLSLFDSLLCMSCLQTSPLLVVL